MGVGGHTPGILADLDSIIMTFSSLSGSIVEVLFRGCDFPWGENGVGGSYNFYWATKRGNK